MNASIILERLAVKSDKLAAEKVPVTIISGALGVGKTTALAYLLSEVRPADEKWAILINEVGEVGLDEALLSGASEGASGEDAVFKQVPGGCICCTNGIMFQMHLTLLLQQEKPDRVLIEPTGIADAGVLIEMLTGRAFGESLDLAATITLVDPRQLFATSGQRVSDYYMGQVDAADVLVANKSDLCDAELLLQFESFARGYFPPKLVVATTTQGRLDGSWLELMMPESKRSKGVHAQETPAFLNVVIQAPVEAPAQTYDAPRVKKSGHVLSVGWLFDAEQRFHAGRLRAWLESFLDEESVPFLRVKGVLQTERGWVSFNLVTDSELDAKASAYRRDARVEVLFPVGDAERVDTNALHEQLVATFWSDERDVMHEF